MTIVTPPLELVDSCLYDEVTINPGDRNPIGLFCVPVFNYDPRQPTSHEWKQYYRTNMLQCGMLPAPERFCIHRLNVCFLTDRPLRLYESPLYRYSFVHLSILRKMYWESPAWQCASPFALFNSPQDEIANMKTRYGIEWSRVGATFEDLVIDKQMSFAVRIDLAIPIESPVTVAVHLDGVSTRAVL